MPELRKDPVMGRWVIIATERAKRPSDFDVTQQEREAGPCVFCEGHEEETPPEIYAVREEGTAPDTPGWDVRVIPNKYPALTIEGHPDREGIEMCDMMNGVGAHEVIVETPDHAPKLADLPEQQIAKVMDTYRQRIVDLREDERLKYVLIFKNQGQVAGASLQHAHSQLIATPITPKRVKEKLVGAKVLRLQASLRLLRLHQAGDRVIRGAIGDRDGALRRAVALCCPVPFRTVDSAQAARFGLYQR